MDNLTQTRELVSAHLRNASSASGYTLCGANLDNVEQYMSVFILMSFVLPSISFIGLCCNAMSFAILIRSGLHKPSNILLFGTVTADSMILISKLDYPRILLYFGPDKIVSTLCLFQYGEALNYFLTVSMAVLYFLAVWGSLSSLVLAIFITGERLLAIFRPMTFRAVVKPKNAKIAVITAFVVWLPWACGYFSYFRIVILHPSESLTWMSLTMDFPYFVHIMETYVICNFQICITVIFVTVGCVAISIKVRLTMTNRQKLISSQNKLSWSPRTTRTLLLTSAIIAVTYSVTAVFSTVSESLSEGLNQVMLLMRILVYPLDASSNLFVYILCDKKMYQIFKKMIRIQTY
ncbi:G-protein coupled receptor [Biomphalaria pfeifferi]|uniref:G-protein coupled receptor n=1 Tax=Biomphalaria pfeifferi TaxID=112525 RepID=A0AAD8C5C7_BIOPF|nr:G-protein coupled receptor [Biomphalaria pfeifferi]